MSPNPAFWRGFLFRGRRCIIDWMAKILVVEDDESLASELARLLDEQGYTALRLSDFHDLSAQILAAQADLVLLDLSLPGLHGSQVLRQLRAQTDLPVIILTSAASELNEVLSISAGADDFIRKPFAPQVLLLRIEALLRRTNGTPGQPLTYHELKLDLAKSTAHHKEREVTLTKNELLILQHLIKHSGQIVSRADLMDQLWDDDRFVDDNTLTVNISRLREKLAELGLETLIQTRRGQGYILV